MFKILFTAIKFVCFFFGMFEKCLINPILSLSNTIASAKNCIHITLDFRFVEPIRDTNFAQIFIVIIITISFVLYVRHMYKVANLACIYKWRVIINTIWRPTCVQKICISPRVFAHSAIVYPNFETTKLIERRRNVRVIQQQNHFNKNKKNYACKQT